jgi:hypothetical protein
VRVHVTRGKGTRGTLVEGAHIGTHAGRWTSQGGYDIRVAGSEHGWGELRGTGNHEHARSTVVSTMSRWPLVGGHPAMVVAVEMHL